MSKRVISLILTLCMLLSLLPATAVATGDAQEQTASTISLPIRTEQEDASDDGGGGVSLMGIEPMREDYIYSYEGIDKTAKSRTVYLDASVTEEPAENGIVKVLGTDAASDPISYYNYSSSKGQYYFYFYLSGLSELKPGLYDLCLAAGNETYALSEKLCVVGCDKLLLTGASAQNFFAGEEVFDVYVTMYGMESEADLEELTFSVYDGEDTLVASSTGRYRVFNIYNGQASFYAEMAVDAGKEIIENGSYRMELSYTGGKTLVDAVGSVQSSAYQPGAGSSTIESVSLLDAQNAALRVKILCRDMSQTYRLSVSQNYDGSNPYAQWEGSAPEDGFVDLPLTFNGNVLPMSAYPSNLYIELEYKYQSYSGDRYSSCDTMNYRNPYANNGGDSSITFYPYAVNPNVKSFDFSIEVRNGCAYYKGSGDVLTMLDSTGNEVGRCEAVTQEYGDSINMYYLKGVMRLTGELSAKRTYTLYLNGVEFDTVFTRSELYASYYYYFRSYENGVYSTWSNLGIVPERVQVLNSSGTGYLQYRSGDAVILSSPLLTGGPSRNPGFYEYRYAFNASELFSKVNSNTEYSLVFQDGSSGETKAVGSNILFSSEVVPYSPGNRSHGYFDWYVSAGEDTFEVRLYAANDNSFRNVSFDEIKAQLKKITVKSEDGSTTYPVVSVGEGSWEDGNYDTYFTTITLSQGLSAGSYTAYYDGTLLENFNVYSAGEESTAPEVYSFRSGGEFALSGRNLPENAVYTGAIYRGYECVRPNIALTWHQPSSATNQYLLLDNSIVTELAPGTYRFRVYMNGTLLDEVDMDVQEKTQPIVSIRDAQNYNSGLLISSGEVWIELSNADLITKIRFAESLEALAEESYQKYYGNMVYDLTLSEGSGEKTVYVQYKDAFGKEYEPVAAKCWRLGEEGLGIYVDESIQGIYRGDTVTLTVGSDCPYVNAYAKFIDGDGIEHRTALPYAGYGPLVGFPDGSETAFDGLESAHPYKSNENKTWYYEDPNGAERLLVTFSPETKLESGYDYLYIYLGNSAAGGTIFASYSGTTLAGKTLEIPSGSFTLQLTSDGSSQYYGFAVTSVVNPDAPPAPEEDAPRYYLYQGTFNTSGYNSNGAGYIDDTERVQFYLGTSEWGEPLSEVVERTLIFGDPDFIILPQFSYGTLRTNQADFVLYGYATPNAEVTLSLSGEERVVTAGAYGRFELPLSGLKDGTYSVTAEDSDGLSSSGSYQLVYDATPPTIANLGLNFLDVGSAVLHWTCEDEDVSYFTVLKNGTRIGDARVNEEKVYSYNISATLDDGNVFTVRAYDEAGNMSSASVSTVDQVPPTAPASAPVVEAKTTRSLTICWTAGTDDRGIAGYNICVGDAEPIQTSGTSLSYTLTGLEQGTEYTITVKTRDMAGNLSENSPALAASTVKLGFAENSLKESYIVEECSNKQIPVGVTVTADDASTPAVTAAELQYRKQGETDWNTRSLFVREQNKLSGVWYISGSSTDGYLPMGNYELRFHVTDSFGAQAYSEPVNVVLLKFDDVPPTAPGTPVSDEHDTSSIDVAWAASTDNVGVDHYEIYRDGVKVAESKTTSYTDSGLAMNTSYRYTIKAVDLRGNVSAPSGEASLKTANLVFTNVTEFLFTPYTMEEQKDHQLALSAQVQTEDGYTVSGLAVSMEYRLGEGEWTSVTMREAESNAYFGAWDLRENGEYLPEGSYTVRFAVTDGKNTAYSDVQAVKLQRDKVPPVVESITYPENGKTYGGKELFISYAASDNVGVTKVELAYSCGGDFTVFHTEEEEYERTSLTDSYTWDASSLPSGACTVRVTAYDLMGNHASMERSFVLDNTPPVPVTDTAAVGTSRYIHVAWDHTDPTDVAFYRVYRSVSATDGFTCLAKSYTDKVWYENEESVQGDTPYYYYITAVDEFDNESEPSPVLSATLVTDHESPAIVSTSVAEGAWLCKEVALSTAATDNYRLAKAVYDYRLAGTEKWNEIASVSCKSVADSDTFAYTWDIAGMTTGTYELRVRVYDDSVNDVPRGYTANDPAVESRTVTIQHYAPPVAPAVSATVTIKTAELTWNYSGEMGLLEYYKIYRANSEGGDYQLLKTVKGVNNSGAFSDPLPRNTTYFYKITVVDRFGSEAESTVLRVTSIGRDEEKPVAVMMPQVLRAAPGEAFLFSAVNSTDNDEIKSYAWSFGDGTTSDEVKPTHTYASAGEYTVSLTVTDAFGNSDTVSNTMTVVDVAAPGSEFSLVTFRVVDAGNVGAPAVSGATLYVFTDETGENGISAITDGDGMATMLLPRGDCAVSVVASGFMPVSKRLRVSEGTDGRMDATIGVSKTSLVSGKLTQEEMTYDEIVAAGIDVNDPANNHVWKFAVTITFTVGLKTFDIPVISYRNSEGRIISGGGSSGGWFNVGGGGSGGGGSGEGWNIGVFPMVHEGFYLIIYGEAHWLKEMYNVELLVMNDSAVDTVENCVAELKLPEGLSLAAMLGEQQSARVELPSIASMSDSRVCWYVRGDEEGEYYLTADVAGDLVSGSISEPFAFSTTTDKPLKVYAGSALKLTITADDIAERGKDYHVKFRLSNVSEKSLYNLSFGITGIEQGKILTLTKSDGERETTLPIMHEEFSDSLMQKVDELAPGGYVEIGISTTCWFNSGAEIAEAATKLALKYMTGTSFFGEFIDVAYYVDQVSVATLEGSTTTVPYEVVINRVERDSLIDKVIFGLANEILDDMIDDEELKSFLGGDLGGTIIELIGDETNLDSTMISGAKAFLKLQQGETDYTFTIHIDDGKCTENSIYNDYITITTGTDTQGVIDMLNGTKWKIEAGEVSVQAKLPGSTKLKIGVEDSIGNLEREYTLDLTIEENTLKESITLSPNEVEDTFRFNENEFKAALKAKTEKELEAFLANPYNWFESELEFNLDQSTSDTNFSATVSAEDFDALLHDSVTTKLTYNGSVAKISFDRAALEVIGDYVEQTQGTDMTVSAARLTDQQMRDLGVTQPTYELSVSGGKGSKLSDFEEGSVYVSLPYALEDNKSVLIKHIKEDGSAEEIAATYNEETGCIEFVTTGFSYFSVIEQAGTVCGSTDDGELCFRIDNLTRGSGNVIAAEYDEQGKMTAMKMIPVLFTAGLSGKTGLTVAPGHSYKIFVLPAGGMTPLCDAWSSKKM